MGGARSAARRVRARHAPPAGARGRSRAPDRNRRRAEGPRRHVSDRLPGAPAHAAAPRRARARVGAARGEGPAEPSARVPAPSSGCRPKPRFLLTDSGGVQEETSALGVRCFTLRDSTERPVTVELGTNTVLGARPDRIAEIPSLLEQEQPGAARSRSGTARPGLARRRRCCMRSARRSLLLEGLALGGLVVAQVLLFGRLVGADTDYDEGVYLDEPRCARARAEARRGRLRTAAAGLVPAPPPDLARGSRLCAGLPHRHGRGRDRDLPRGVPARAEPRRTGRRSRRRRAPHGGAAVPALRPPGTGRHPAARGVPARSLARLGSRASAAPLRRRRVPVRCSHSRSH